MNIRRSRTRRTGVGLLVIAVAALGACSSETKRSIDDASTTVASSSTTVLADVTTTLSSSRCGCRSAESVAPGPVAPWCPAHS